MYYFTTNQYMNVLKHGMNVKVISSTPPSSLRVCEVSTIWR